MTWSIELESLQHKIIVLVFDTVALSENPGMTSNEGQSYEI